MVHQFGCVELLLPHLTTAKPLTKLVTGGGFFSTDVCPCSVALASPPVCCISFFLFSASIFFLNISMKLPSLANAFPPGTEALLAVGAGLLDGDAGLPQLESPLLPLLVWGLPCARFESMLLGRNFHKRRPPAQRDLCVRLLKSMALLMLAFNNLHYQHRLDPTRDTI